MEQVVATVATGWVLSLLYSMVYDRKPTEVNAVQLKTPTLDTLNVRRYRDLGYGPYGYAEGNREFERAAIEPDVSDLHEYRVIEDYVPSEIDTSATAAQWHLPAPVAVK